MKICSEGNLQFGNFAKKMNIGIMKPEKKANTKFNFQIKKVPHKQIEQSGKNSIQLNAWQDEENSNF